MKKGLSKKVAALVVLTNIGVAGNMIIPTPVYAKEANTAIATVQGLNGKVIKDGLYNLSAKTLKEDSDETSMAGTYLEKVNYEVKGGKQYLILSLNRLDWMKDIKIKVDGKESNHSIEITEKNDKGEEKGNIKVEVSSLDSKIVMNMNVVPMGNSNLSFRIVTDKNSLKDVNKAGLIKGEIENKDSVKQEEKIKPEEKENTAPVITDEKVIKSQLEKLDGNKIADGTYTISLETYRIDKPDQTSMLGGFFDKNVKLEVKGGKAKIILLNNYMAYSLYDLRIESNGVYTESVAKPYGQKNKNDEYDMQTFEIQVSNLDSPHYAGVLVSPMGGQRSDIGNIDKYTKLKIIFDKNIKSGWDGFEQEKKATDNDKLLNEALVAAGLDKDNDGKVSDIELAEAKGEIDLSDREIGDITRLSKLGSDVTELYLNGNKIRTLPEGVFDNLTELKGLYLSGNIINQLPKGIFDKLDNLENLALSSNLINELPEGIFDKLTNLTEELSIGNNRLKQLPKEVFNKLTKLKNLELAKNNIEVLPDDIFNKLTDLEGLYLYENQIINIPTGISNLTKLRSLYVNNNKISVLPKEIGNLKNLDRVDLSRNYIKEITEEAYEGLENVSTLNISDNQLTHISDNIVEKLKKIENLDLSLNMFSKTFNSSQEFSKKISFYPQKVDMDLKLFIKDDEISWTHKLSLLDILCWYRTPSENMPTNIDEYKAFLNNREIKDLLNDKGFDWTITTKLQKEDSNSKWITISDSSVEEENDIEGNFKDTAMKKGDKYRLIKSIYASNSGTKELVFTTISDAVTSESNKSDTEVNSKEYKKEKSGLYNLNVKILKENSDEASMASAYVKSVNYEVENGKRYIVVTIDRSDWMKDLKVTVDGVETPYTVVESVKNSNNEETKRIRFLIDNLDSKINLSMNVVPMGEARVSFRIVTDKDTLKLIKKYNNIKSENSIGVDKANNEKEDKLVKINSVTTNSKDEQHKISTSSLPKTGSPFNSGILGSLGILIGGLGISLKKRRKR